MFQLKKHGDLVLPWKQAMATGLMNGRPFSKTTQNNYVYYVNNLLAKHGKLSYETLRNELSSIPVEHFSTKNFIYAAAVSFGKYLISENALTSSFLEQVKKIKPKRHLPPKRLTVNEGDVIKLIQACEKLIDRLIVILLVSTGLRASEACSLRISDLDFENGQIIVQVGKWGKTRRVGITDGLNEALNVYLKERDNYNPDELLLIGREGVPIDRNGLYKRLLKLGRKAGVIVTPHALRRAFVTINVANNIPLVYLQIACGHTDIKTTRSYCQTSEDEVIEAMKTRFANFS